MLKVAKLLFKMTKIEKGTLLHCFQIYSCKHNFIFAFQGTYEKIHEDYTATFRGLIQMFTKSEFSSQEHVIGKINRYTNAQHAGLFNKPCSVPRTSKTLL